MTERDEPRVEEILSFLCEDVGDDLGRVGFRSLFRSAFRSRQFITANEDRRDAPNNESTFILPGNILLVSLLEEFDVLLKHSQIHSDFGRINNRSTSLSHRTSTNSPGEGDRLD